MKVPHPLFKQISTLNHLPTLPHILLKLIETCNTENPDLGRIAEIVEKDPALSATILKLVNSAYFGLFRKIEVIKEAVVLVGTSGIRNMALCACIYDAFPRSSASGRFNLKQFWWHSLRCAVVAKRMAAEWEVGSPDEAFLAGLLHDIGKVVLWINFKKPYEALLAECGTDADLMLAGEAAMGASHAEVGAWLLERWCLDPLAVDCARYHHESHDRILQALGMVQVVHVANLLCRIGDDRGDAGLTAAMQLLGREAHECRRLVGQADEEARHVAALLGIDADRLSPAVDVDVDDDDDAAVRQRLIADVHDLTLTMGTLEGFLSAEDPGAVMRCVAEGLQLLFDVKRPLFFLLEEKMGALIGHFPDKTGRYTRHPALAISTQMTGSLVIQSLAEREWMDSHTAPSPLAIIDEQFVRLLGRDGMACLPLIAQNEPVGVLAMGIDGDERPHLLEKIQPLKILIHKGALALRLDAMRRRQLPLIRSQRLEASSDLARRVVHEVNNPLGVIKNYLKVLGMKMAASGIAHDEIRIINDEISRVARLLKKLTTFSDPETSRQRAVDINALLEEIVRLTAEPLLKESGIRLDADLEPSLPAVAADPDGIKQVVINLIKNAAEAMAPKGGRIDIATRFISPPLGEKNTSGGAEPGGMVELVVRDDGPGIPESIRETLFDPYVSTKQGGHSGLGLSVVHNIVRILGGTMACDSSPEAGTSFIINLPAVAK